jgi:hypothetical protein
MDGAQRSQSRLDRSSLRAEGPRLVGTALYNALAAVAARKICEAIPHGRRNGVKAVRRVVWARGANYSPGTRLGILIFCFTGANLLQLGLRMWQVVRVEVSSVESRCGKRPN